MATLVTGDTGFVASNIVKILAERGHEVIVFDLVGPHPLLQEYIKPWADKVTFVQGDILKPEELGVLAKRDINKIVHAAVFTGVLPDIEAGRSRSIVDINVMGTTNLLELARNFSLERFLYVSSGSIYGDGQDPNAVLSETTAPQPRTLYALTKYSSELLTRRYGELHGFPSVSTRLGTPFGPMERVTGHRENQSALKQWTGNIVRGEPITVGNRALQRTFTYVADIANGIATVLDAPALSHDVYNVTGEERATMATIVDTLAALEPGLVVKDAPPDTEVRGGAALSSSRVREDLGYAVQHDLRSGIEDYLKWRRANDFTE